MTGIITYIAFEPVCVHQIFSCSSYLQDWVWGWYTFLQDINRSCSMACGTHGSATRILLVRCCNTRKTQLREKKHKGVLCCDSKCVFNMKTWKLIFLLWKNLFKARRKLQLTTDFWSSPRNTGAGLIACLSIGCNGCAETLTVSSWVASTRVFHTVFIIWLIWYL